MTPEDLRGWEESDLETLLGLLDPGCVLYEPVPPSRLEAAYASLALAVLDLIKADYSPDTSAEQYDHARRAVTLAARELVQAVDSLPENERWTP